MQQFFSSVTSSNDKIHQNSDFGLGGGWCRDCVFQCVSRLLMDFWRIWVFTEQRVSISSGAEFLHGTLVRPSLPSSVAVLVWPGSGPVDRDGNLPGMTNNSYALLSRGLAEHGLTLLRVDKRGIGLSSAALANESCLCFQDNVDDAIAWLDFLSRQDGISRLAVIGHSEGALVATLAASRKAVDALVLLCGCGGLAGQAIRRQLADAAVPTHLRQAADRILSELEAGRTVEDVPSELMVLFRPSVQPYLMSWLSLDPAVKLAQAPRAALIIQGEADLQVGMEDARRLAAARSDNRLVVISGMNHVLKDAPLDRGANLQTYNQPDLPLSAGLVPLLADYLLPK